MQKAQTNKEEKEYKGRQQRKTKHLKQTQQNTLKAGSKAETAQQNQTK